MLMNHGCLWIYQLRAYEVQSIKNGLDTQTACHW